MTHIPMLLAYADAFGTLATLQGRDLTPGEMRHVEAARLAVEAAAEGRPLAFTRGIRAFADTAPPVRRAPSLRIESRADLEKALRDAGLPKAAAKAVAAGGFAALNPDAARRDLTDTIRRATARLTRKD
jgi:hypothetical protein